MEDSVGTFQSALASGSWQAIIGILLLILPSVVASILEGKVDESLSRWVSLFRGVATGLGAPLVASAAADVPWWVPVAGGALGLIQSAGFQQQVRELIPDRRTTSGGTLVLVALFLATSAGCSVRQAQVAVRTGLTSADEGLASADRLLATEAQDDSEAALDTIRSECGTPCPDAVERYRTAMESWREISRALRATHEAILTLDDGVDVWIRAGFLPGGWGEVCDAGSLGLGHLLSAVEAASDRDAPPALVAAPGALRLACQAAGPYLHGGE